MRQDAGYERPGESPRHHALRAISLIALATTLAGAAGRIDAATQPTASSRGRYLMGTRLTIECRGEVAPRLFDAAFEEVARLEGILSNWIDSSEVSRMNRAATRAPFSVSGDLLHAVEVSLAWAERTEGAFDPTVEPLVRRYGIRDRADSPALDAKPPDRGSGTSIEGMREADDPTIGWRYVEVDPGRKSVYFTREGIGLDLGGIGKGIALDAAARILLQGEVAGGLLDFGGQVIAVGETGPDDGWLIGVADPSMRERAVAVVTLRRGSLATSGNSERAVTGGQGPVGHILDPHAGRPARFTGSVSVLAGSGTAADALSTALFVMGPERGVAWAEARGIAALYIRSTEEGDLEFVPTLAMRQGFDWMPMERNDHTGD